MDIRGIQRKKRGFADLIAECGDYMAPGTYHVTVRYGKLALKKGGLKARRLKDWYHFLIFGTYRIQNKQGRAHCETALLSMFGNYKMFDEAAGRVYTRLAGAYWDRALLFYERMSPYLPSAIVSFDRDHRVMVERFTHDRRDKDGRRCFDALCDAWLKYMDAAASDRALSFSQVRAAMASASLPEGLRESVRAIERQLEGEDEAYPVIVCHNDVHLNNILTEDNESFCLIDFELCGENAFFFDMMGLVLNSAAFQKNDALLEPFFRGELDPAFERLFEKAGMTYRAERKLRYVYLFLYLKLYMIHAMMPESLPGYTERIKAFLALLEARQ